MFTDGDLDLIRETVERFSSLSRTELALTLCENLPWQAPNGQARLHPCLSLLEEMDADGIIKIPAKRVLAPYRPAHLHAQPLPPQEIVASLRELQPVTVEPVAPEEQAL